MAEATVTRTQLTLEYYGEGDSSTSGGRYTYSGLKHTATDAGISQTARAINNLQDKIAKTVFKTVQTELED